MLEVSIERLRAQIGAHAAGIVQDGERLATLAGAAVADRQNVGKKPETIGFERSAQSGRHIVHILAGSAGKRRNAGQ